MKKRTEVQKRQADQMGNGSPTLVQEVLYLLIKIGMILVAACLVFTFLFGLLRYHAGNMDPSIREGDLILYYRLDKDYAAGDLLLVEYENQYQVQRVVATAGDTVDIKDGSLIINGAVQLESHIYTTTSQYEEGINFPVTIEDGEVFVLSDNRENATDSRIYGCVSQKDTLGAVMTIIRRRNF